MLYAIYAVFGIGTLFAGEWLYRTLLRPIDPITSAMISLGGHFSSSGISVSSYAVRHGFLHSKVRAVAAYRIENFPFPILITQAASGPEAVLQFEQLKTQSAGLPPFLQPARHGTLIMSLSFWGDDTESMAKKVQNAFASAPEEISQETPSK